MKTPSNNQLAVELPPWERAPRQLISLLDMIPFSVSEFGIAEFLVRWQHAHFKQLAIESGYSETVNEEAKRSLLGKLNEVKPKCRTLNLDMTKAKCETPKQRQMRMQTGTNLRETLI